MMMMMVKAKLKILHWGYPGPFPGPEDISEHSLVYVRATLSWYCSCQTWASSEIWAYFLPLSVSKFHSRFLAAGSSAIILRISHHFSISSWSTRSKQVMMVVEAKRS